MGSNPTLSALFSRSDAAHIPSKAWRDAHTFSFNILLAVLEQGIDPLAKCAALFRMDPRPSLR